MLNRDEIIARVKEMREGIEYLSGITESSLQNKENFLLARYHLQMLLEAMFVIGNQIISTYSFRKLFQLRRFSTFVEFELMSR